MPDAQTSVIACLGILNSLRFSFGDRGPRLLGSDSIPISWRISINPMLSSSLTTILMIYTLFSDNEIHSETGPVFIARGAFTDTGCAFNAEIMPRQPLIPLI